MNEAQNGCTRSRKALLNPSFEWSYILHNSQLTLFQSLDSTIVRIYFIDNNTPSLEMKVAQMFLGPGFLTTS